MLAGLLPDGATLAAFAAATLVLSLTPGPDTLLTVGRTLQGGPRAGAAAALGVVAGCAVHTLSVAAGLSALLALVPAAFTALQWAGAAYLIWLGVDQLRTAWRGAPTQPPARATPPRRAWADFRTGLLTNVLNPKVALFFVAFLPPFVPAGTPSVAASLGLLGLWFVGQNLLYMLALVAVAQRLRRMPAPTGLRRALQAASGLMFIALAWRLLQPRAGSSV